MFTLHPSSFQDNCDEPSRWRRLRRLARGEKWRGVGGPLISQDEYFIKVSANLCYSKFLAPFSRQPPSPNEHTGDPARLCPITWPKFQSTRPGQRRYSDLRPHLPR